MAAKIQVARGDITGKQSTTKLVPAELFWQARTSDSDNKNDEYTKWDEGTLYVGRPSLNLNKAEEKPIPIAGGRSYFAVVNRGYLSNETSIQDTLFEHARVGDMYIWSNDAKSGLFHNSDDFRKDDLLLILDIGGDANISTVSGKIYDQSLIKYKRINSSGGYADDVYFTQDGKEDGQKWTDFDSTNVQDALLELNYQKLQYIGTIGTASQIPVKPIIGGLYLITADQLTFNSNNDTFTPDKGDFVYWKQPNSESFSSGKWVQIPSGYSNADEIDYYDYDDDKDLFISNLYTTFTEDHISGFKKSSDNVKQMLDFLMAQKAQLDEQGKIPLSQLHDTVLGALQFRGVWNPLKDDVVISTDLKSIDGKMYVLDDKVDTIVNPLPGLKEYTDGDTTEATYSGLNDGDYYYVQCQEDVLNLQYNFNNVNFELNTGDWIVWQSSQVLDNTSEGTVDKTGFWSKLDNTDRLTAMQYVIDVQNKDNFFVTHEIDESVLTLVGSPRLKAQNKIGLENLGNNTVAITGRGLIDQLEYDNPLPNFLVRYDNEKGTVKNSFIEEIGNDDDKEANTRNEHFKEVATTNITRMHANLEVGDINELRYQKVYGNIIVAPHISSTADQTTYDKSLLQFLVDAADDTGTMTTRTVSLVAPSGLTATEGYGIDEDKPDEATTIILPEHTSTLIGKLAGIEFQSGRLLKSVDEGYTESTSIEEHINDETNDSNNHDSINNIIEFHSSVSIPITNAYEYYFGDWNTTAEGAYYDEEDFDENGKFNRQWKTNKLTARLVKNTYQEETNITVMLPTESGTLMTEESLQDFFGSDDGTYLTMFGESKTLGTGITINTLQKSPLRQIQNALRCRLLNSKTSKDSEYASTQENIAKITANEYAPSKGDGTFKSTIDISVADTVIENDLIAGQFDDAGNLINKKSIVGTRAIGVSDPDYGTLLIQGARQNFPDAEQYYDPKTGDATLPVDVVVDAPNESGVMLTSNSVVSGGVWNS